MIDKTLSTSERYAALCGEAGKLAEFCQALYPLLNAHADDFGCLQGDPFTVKHLVHPTSPRKVREFHAALTALHNVRLITWYEAPDPESGEPKQYIYIRGFSSHQDLKGHDGRKRHYPEPPQNPSKIAHSPQIPPDSPKPALREEKGREEKGTEGKEERVSGADAPPLSAQELSVMWNQVARECGLPTCREVSGKRLTRAEARIREHGDPQYWRMVIGRIAASDFCRGVTDRGTWRASFDWLVQPDAHVKVLEGKYDNREGPTLSKQTRQILDASAEFLAMGSHDSNTLENGHGETPAIPTVLQPPRLGH
jgi:hypothetical protein